ncbi:hypothetical protein E2C01_082572 [Portunus trituberculatus]|uniref:Uncharacterized protein n=1 Tax=Portunus trituberculatus TaxID=210409 RepID=A0A5B7ISQ0_PORTR|nr:hypothetical protein [Portunus trituberculatus]
MHMPGLVVMEANTHSAGISRRISFLHAGRGHETGFSCACSTHSHNTAANQPTSQPASQTRVDEEVRSSCPQVVLTWGHGLIN